MFICTCVCVFAKVNKSSLVAALVSCVIKQAVVISSLAIASGCFVLGVVSTVVSIAKMSQATTKTNSIYRVAFTLHSSNCIYSLAIMCNPSLASPTLTVLYMGCIWVDGERKGCGNSIINHLSRPNRGVLIKLQYFSHMTFKALTRGTNKGI